MKKLLSLIILSSVFLLNPIFGEEKLLDFWEDSIRGIAWMTKARPLDASIKTNRHPNYHYNWPTKGFKLNHNDFKVGDLSLGFYPEECKSPGKVGFLGNLWGGSWQLDSEMELTFYLKTTGENNQDKWEVVLVDDQDKKAMGTLTGVNTSNEWKEVKYPLNNLKVEVGFNWDSVELLEFVADFDKQSVIHFDGVCFKGKSSTVGVSDKSVTQRMKEARENKGFRINYAMSIAALGHSNEHFKAVTAFAKMYLGEDLEGANQLLVEHIERSVRLNDSWCLLTTPLYCRIYFWFSERVGKFPGRLDPKVEKLLLKTIWDRTYVKNDIHWSKKSTWWMDGSENHDLNAKASNLVSSLIFMNEPEYKDLIYPDYGFGGGYKYGASGYYGKGIDPSERHNGGRANLKLEDQGEYNAEDHYHAWKDFLKEYFSERARRGFFLENSADGYSKHTLNMVDLAYQYCGDEELKKIIGDFYTVYWADWAQKQISGVHGGPKTRHKTANTKGFDSTVSLIKTLLGGSADGGIWWYWNMFNDYELPKVVWHMALDRQGMGEFVYQARGIGEEENLWPRPLGAERTLLCDTDSRILKYNYVTPDYVLGTQMDHPGLVHSHLSITSRWQGLIVDQSPKSRVVPVSYPESKRDIPDDKKYQDTSNVMQNFQHKNVLIMQQARNFYRINPTWFPGLSPKDEEPQVIALYTGNDWDEKLEREGWVFLKKGQAYAAVKPVLWDKEYEDEMSKKGQLTQAHFNDIASQSTVKIHDKAYKWSVDNVFIELESRYSPVILQAGREAEYGSFEGFITKIISNPIALNKTVVPGFYILTYRPFGEEGVEMEFNAGTTDMPMIDGVPVNYELPMTFDSPYLSAEYKSGKIRLEFGEERLDLDFPYVRSK